MARGRERPRYEEEKKEWIPKTKLGQSVMKGEFKSLEEILEKGLVVLEPEIVDYFIPDIKEEVVYIGGSPGKGGGTRRTATKRTARMHKSGRRFTLTALVIIGNENGIVGLGESSSREHRIALEKAITQAKLNVIRVRKGCGSWECGCKGDHSIPRKTTGKFGSVSVVLKPGPKGLGIVSDSASKKLLALAGIKDIWVTTIGSTSTRKNLIYAVFGALKNLNSAKGV